MAYAPDGRIIHDADAHVVETPDFYDEFTDAYTRERMPRIHVDVLKPGETDLLDEFRRRHGDEEFRSRDEVEIMTRKNWEATGSFLKEDRTAALDLLGFSTQLMFNTFANNHLYDAERGDDLDLAYGFAAAHNRAMVDFCSVDRRLLPVGYVPLADFERSKAFTAEAIELGCRALMIASAPPRRHSPSHVGLDPVWSQAEDAGIPIVLHVGGGGKLLDPIYFENGLPPVPDFHGGDGNFRSVDYMAIPYPVMQTLATLIIDGVLDRFPALRIGVIEQGACWLPGLMKSLDSAQNAFQRNEQRLQSLSLRASEYITRQVRVTPYPHEDAGWVIDLVGDDVCMFSSDYPHVEGGRNPLKRFDESLRNVTVEAQRRFYGDNFIDLMGAALDRDLAVA
jgi:predicted TIM-barrel fold metal-dependent hydrolase